MEINNFSSFFEFLGGLNLGFVAINFFKKDFSEKVFKPNKRVSLNLNYQIDRIDAQLSEDSGLTEEKRENFLQLKTKADVQSRQLKISEESYRYFLEVFEPVSFLMGLFCLMALLMGGFQNDGVALSGANNSKSSYEIFLFLLGSFCTVFTYSVFFGSFSKRILVNKVKLPLIQIIIVFAVFSTISFILSFFYRCMISKFYFIFIILPLVPGLLYAILSLISILNVDRYSKKKPLQLVEGIFGIVKENWKQTLYYLIILYLFLVPIYLYCCSNNEHVYPLYLVILTVPILLFVFISIRVLIHRSHFQKKSDYQAEIIANSLDMLL